MATDQYCDALRPFQHNPPDVEPITASETPDAPAGSPGASGTRRLQANWRGMSFDARRRQDRDGAARAVVRRTERVQVILAADELAAIEEFRFQARMPSRSAAVRELLRRGLARASRSRGARPMPRSRSSKC
jgi:hypothetical protein